jgi:hypothetical protein
MQKTPSGRRMSYRRFRQKAAALRDRLPRGAVTSASLIVVVLFGLGIIAHHPVDDLSVGAAVAGIGVAGLLLQLIGRLRVHCTERRRIAAMKRRPPST